MTNEISITNFLAEKQQSTEPKRQLMAGSSSDSHVKSASQKYEERKPE